MPRNSRLVEILGGPQAAWGITDWILADMFDALQIANWQRSKDGTTGLNQPKPYPRPGIITNPGHSIEAMRQQMAAWNRGDLEVASERIPQRMR